MTNIQKPSPALSPRIVLCGRLFSFIPCSFSGALLRAATSDSAPYIRLCGQTFSFSLLCLLPIRQVSICALGMTNIQKPSPALSPRSVLCGRLFPFIPCSFSGALLRAATSDSAPYIRLCGQTFSFSLLCLLPIRQVSICALGMTNIQKPSPALSPRSVLCGRLFSFIPFLSQVRCFALRLPTLRTDFFFLFVMPFADTHISIRGAVQPRRSESVRSKNSALSLKNS